MNEQRTYRALVGQLISHAVFPFVAPHTVLIILWLRRWGASPGLPLVKDDAGASQLHPLLDLHTWGY